MTSVVRNLQAVVSNLSEEQISRDISAIDLIPLLMYVNSEAAVPSDVYEAAPIIRKIWRVFGTETLVSTFGSKLSDIITSTTSQGREVILSCLQDSVMTESGIQCVVSAGLFDFVLDSLKSDALACAGYASGLLVTASLLKPGLEALFTTERVQRMSEIACCSDSVKYRVFELCVKVATASDGGYERCVERGVFASMITDLDLDDVLLQLNCIELLGQLAESSKGFRYLTETGVVTKLANMLTQWPLNPLLSFVIPGVVRFFGNLCLSSPGNVQAICKGFPSLVTTILMMLQKNDASLVGIAVDTIGVLGSTSGGRLVIKGTSNNGKDLIRTMGKIMQFSESPIRIRCIEALCSLFKHLDSLPDSSETAHSWYLALHSQPMQTIFSIASQPFEDFHKAGVKLLISISSNAWGLYQMQMCPGLLEFCLDRSTETTKAGKELKYELVRTMVDTENALEILGTPVMLQLKMYVRDGPFYIAAQSTIAMESSN